MRDRASKLDDLSLNPARRVLRAHASGFVGKKSVLIRTSERAGFCGRSTALKIRKDNNPCLGFCALRLIPQKQRHAGREFCRASLSKYKKTIFL
jgi:phosphoenolpyruvate-protein kinase (PTS system EI component)